MRQRPRASQEAIQRHVANRVRMRRLTSGISQKELAKRIGVSEGQILKYEFCRDQIRTTRLYDIAIALECPIQWFFQEMPVGDVPPGQKIPLDTLKIDRIEMLRNFELLPGYQRKAVRSLITQLVVSKPRKIEAV